MVIPSEVSNTKPSEKQGVEKTGQGTKFVNGTNRVKHSPPNNQEYRTTTSKRKRQEGEELRLASILTI